jgi:hypothetical protein
MMLPNGVSDDQIGSSCSAQLQREPASNSDLNPSVLYATLIWESEYTLEGRRKYRRVALAGEVEE